MKKTKKEEEERKEKKEEEKTKNKGIFSERLFIITWKGDRKFVALRVPEHLPPCSCGTGRLEAK